MHAKMVVATTCDAATDESGMPRRTTVAGVYDKHRAGWGRSCMWCRQRFM